MHPKTLTQELEYQDSMLIGKMRRERAEMIRGLKEVIRTANEVLKEIETETTDEMIISNDRMHIQITVAAEQVARGNAGWFAASQMKREMDFIKMLHEKEKVK
jgi:hypothetical protein